MMPAPRLSRAIGDARVPCASAPLVEARRDGRLVGREAGSLERHLLVCAECRKLDRSLEEVRAMLRKPAGTPVSPFEHQRSRLALLRAAASPSGPPSSAPSRSRMVTALVACGLGLLTVAGAAAARPRAGVPVARHLPMEQVNAAALIVASTALPAARTETLLAASSDAHYERNTVDHVERVALTEGTLDLHVRKLGEGERFIVATDDAEVEVRGTVFEVEAHGGRIARVDVSEGKVEVRRLGAVSIVPAGGAWRVGPDSEREPQIPARAPSPTLAAVRPVELGEVHEKPAGRASAPVDHDASNDFGRAVGLLGQGDYAAARVRLDAFREAHPTDDRADLAAFLTIVSLQRAGRRAEAADAARQYLARYPQGDRRAEAQRVANGR